VRLKESKQDTIYLIKSEKQYEKLMT